jgi:septum formation protein
MKIILASKSPRRKEILSSLGFKFDVIVSDTDENSNITDPAMLVSELSRRKGMAVAQQKELFSHGNEYLIISSDTLVFCGGEIFGKPADTEDARRMIRALSGRTHSVFSGMTVIKISGSGEISEFTDFEETLVTFREMSESDISLYLSRETVTDKAGAYAIQGIASLWIDGINGNYFNVVGLPINKLRSLLCRAGIELESLIIRKNS